MEFVKPVKKQQETEKSNLEQRLLTWPECYYLERSPKIRGALLSAAEEAGLTPEENVFRRRLYDLRYPGKNGPDGTPIDLFLKIWMELRFMSEQKEGLFTKLRPEKLMKIMEGAAIKEADTEQKQKILYDEYYHLCMLYIALCKEDKQYNSVMFGFGRVTEDRQAERVGAEVKAVAKITPVKFGCVDEMRIWTEAIVNAYCDMYPDTGIEI